MTRSIFDPTGGDTEHSGNRYMGPRADNDAHMPNDVVDGEVSQAEAAENEAAKPIPGLEDLARAVAEENENFDHNQP